MTLADRLDDYGKPAWIALVVVGFVVFWPLGFVALGYMIGSRRMGCWRGQGGYGPQRWQDHMDRFQQRMQEKMDRAQRRMQEKAARWAGARYAGPSGNHAFDEYRTETLRRLEEEQREFMEFLDRLRHAKDKAEFDQFMAERRSRPENPAPPPPQY
jgi:hypothetical protein